MDWPADPLAWFNLAASVASFAGLGLTLWTLVLVRRMKDQRARLVLLPHNLARVRTRVERIMNTDDAYEAWRDLQEVEVRLRDSSKLVSGEDKRALFRECAALNRFSAVENPSQLPPLRDLGGPANHALVVFEGIVQRIRLQEP